MNETSSKKFLSTRSIEKIYQFSFNTLQNYGSYLLAPSLRHIIEKFPNLHRKPLTPNMHYLVGALNGVLGDYLLKYHNPVALPMVLYDHYGAVQQGELSGRVDYGSWSMHEPFVLEHGALWRYRGKTADATCTKHHAISQLQHGSSYFSQWA